MMHMTLRHAAVAALVLLVAFAVVPAANAVTVERVRSPGGIEAWLVRDDTVPLISLRFAFRGGTRLEPAGREGLANLVSGLLDEGAGPYDSQTFQRAMEDISMQMSFGASRDNFRGSLRTLNEFRDQAIDLLALALSKPRFDEEPVARGLERMLAMRAYMRAKTVDGVIDGAIAARVGLNTRQIEDMYQIMAIANYEDRFVIPTAHRETSEDAYQLRGACGFSFGNGCSPDTGNLFSGGKLKAKNPMEIA